jgi:hypothetical protein
MEFRGKSAFVSFPTFSFSLEPVNFCRKTFSAKSDDRSTDKRLGFSTCFCKTQWILEDFSTNPQRLLFLLGYMLTFTIIESAILRGKGQAFFVKWKARDAV